MKKLFDNNGVITRQRLYCLVMFFLSLAFSSLVTAGTQLDDYFLETFEDDPAEMANETGNPWAGQHSWLAMTANYTNRTHVQTTVCHGGSKAGSLTNTAIWMEIDNDAGNTNIWIDLYARPPHRLAATSPSPSPNSAAAFFVNSNGYVQAWDGTEWTTQYTAFAVSQTGWTRFTLHLDYSSSKWDLYACDSTQNKLSTLLATNLSFNSTATNTSLAICKVNAYGELNTIGYIDDITLANGGTTNMPLSIDTDSDGMADRWEIAYLGSIAASSGSSDTDVDGFTDLQEYIAGTDPDDAASYLRIANCDLLAETGNDIVLAFAGGDKSGASGYAGDAVINRRVIAYAADSAAASKTSRGSVQAHASGTTNWIDTGAVLATPQRFYHVGASMVGSSYINTNVEWAFHVQNRPADEKFLICVPVNYENAASNNLNSKLGGQIARGLYASGSTSTADRIQFMVSNVWRQFYIVTNSVGGRYWWDADTGSTADVHVAAGQAFWVIRGTNSASRTNSVFASRSFTVSTVTNFTVTTNYGGWTMLGWALPQSKTHNGSTSNQLGFVAAGASGGQTTDTDYPTKIGDQIWVWDNDTWQGLYWLLGNWGLPAYDGRWWDSEAPGGGNFAVFSLRCGKAYYYYHPAANQWGADDFTWSPTNAP